MRYKIVLFIYYVIIYCCAAGADDIETILMQDDSILEYEILGKKAKEGALAAIFFDRISGVVMVKGKKNEKWETASEDTILTEGDSVMTIGESQGRLLLSDGTVIDVRDKSQILIETLRMDLETGLMVEVKIFSGKIGVYPKDCKYFKVIDKTEKTKIDCTKGEALIDIDSSNNNEIVVYDGEIDILNLNQPEIIKIKGTEKIVINGTGNIVLREKHNLKKLGDIKNIEEKNIERMEVFGKGKGKLYITGEAGTFVLNDSVYSKIRVSPVFKELFNKTVNIGLEAVIVQEPDKKGKIKYGSKAGDKWYEFIKIDRIEINNEFYKFNYGETGKIKTGEGMLLDGYSTFGVETKIGDEKSELRFIVPVKEIFNLDIDSVYIARGEIKSRKSFQFGVTYVFDSDINKEKMNKSGIETDILWNMIPEAVPFIEYCSLEKYGAAILSGVKGSTGMINYKAAYLTAEEKFKISLYNEFYKNLKETINLSNIKRYEGYIVEAGIDKRNISAKIGYESIPAAESIGVFGNLDVKIKEKFMAGLFYKQIDACSDSFKWTPKNTAIIKGYMNYKINKNVEFASEYIKNAGEDTHITFKTIVNF